MLEKYKNTKDEDIQSFLNSKAMNFEERKLCNTYLLIDEERDKDKRIEGYFTLSFKVYEFKGISNSMKKRLCNGFSNRASIPVILIGQLGKYVDEYNENYGCTSANELLDMAFSIIEEVTQRVPCSCVLLECKVDEDKEKLQSIYLDYGFEEICRDSSYIQYGYKL